MITLFDLWQKFTGKVNTHQGGHVRPNRNFVDWVNDIQLEIFEELYKEWEKTQANSDRLAPFLRSVNIVIFQQSGQMWDLIKLPADYEHFSSARVQRYNGRAYGNRDLPALDSCSGEKVKCSLLLDEDEKAFLQQSRDAELTEAAVKKVTNNRWSAITEHKNLRPTFEAPACSQFSDGLKVAPKGLGVIILDYLRRPRKGSFEYTISNPNTEQEYIQFDATKSVPLEWSETMIPEFLTRLQKNYGTFARDRAMYEQGELGKK